MSTTITARVAGFVKNLSRLQTGYRDGNITVKDRETNRVIGMKIHCPTDDKSANILLDDASALQLCRRIMGQIAPMNLVDECMNHEVAAINADIDAMKKYIVMFEEATRQKKEA